MSVGNEHTTTLQLAIVWAIVGIPLLWGLFKTLGNAMALFY